MLYLSPLWSLDSTPASLFGPKATCQSDLQRNPLSKSILSFCRFHTELLCIVLVLYMENLGLTNTIFLSVDPGTPCSIYRVAQA
jgi:hypothetical protein